MNDIDLKDYFAAKAMQAFMADPKVVWEDAQMEEAARCAYQMAYYMLVARGQA